MNPRRETNRRDFLTGRSAVRAVEDLAEAGVAGPPPSPLASPRQAASYLVEISRRAMATDFQIYLNAGQYPDGPDAALKALDLVEALEQQLSVFRESSELMSINRRAAKGPVGVELRLFALLQYAIQLCSDTQGAFDITSGPLSKVWGFYRRAGMIPDELALNEARSRVGGGLLELDPQQQTIRFLSPGVEINVNALGKGYALDRCGEVLEQMGVEHYLIHGGKSSVLAHGSREQLGTGADGWSVALRHPLKPAQRLAEVRICDRAVGTSGSSTQFFHHQGRRYGHVLDPRTAWPAEGLLSATVLAPTAAEADALSTAFFVLGREQSTEYCSRHPGLSAILVSSGQRSGSIELHAIGLAEDSWRRVAVAESGKS